MAISRTRTLPDGRTVAVYSNKGLRKVCPCARTKWVKCSHPWHFSFAWRGKLYRISLDRHAGRHLDSKTEAESIADEIRTQIRAGTFGVVAPSLVVVAPATSASNLRDAGDTWHKKRGYQLVASRDNEYRFKRFCDFTMPGTEPPITLGDKDVTAITASDIEAFRHARRSKGLSAVTVNHDIKLLRKMFRWFVREGIVPETPLRFRGEVVIKLDRETPRERRLAEAAQEARLLEVAEPLLHDLIVFMLDTCCRPGEGLKLQWQDVNFLRREVTIRPENTKTRERRCLPVTARLMKVLEARRFAPDGKRLPPESYVFGNAVGEPVASVRRQWERARVAAELGELHLADLRHEAGSAYEEAGMPTTYVSKMLGHRNLATTTRYLNPTAHNLRKAIEKRDEERSKSAGLANSLQSQSTPVEQTPPQDETQPNAKSLIS